MGEYLIAPPDYEHGFILKTAVEDLIFYVKERVDRDIIVHELYNICKQVSTEIELMSARQEVMDKIDPIDSFNAWNLSIVCGPTTKQQEAFQSSGLKHRLDSISEQSQIIKAESTYVSYIRDGVRCFISQTLRKELFITDGYLFKKSRTKIKMIKGKYRQIFASIDFKKLLIRFK